MDQLDVEIAAYNRMRAQLEADHKGEWAVIHGEEFVGTYPDFQVAADTAVRRFGRGPYLIREIGAPPIVIPRYIVERQSRPKEVEMDQLDVEIAAYNRMRAQLEADHPLAWVIIHNEELIGTYPDFPEAAESAVKRFGREGCLLRQVGKPPVTVPAAIPERPDSAQEVEREPGPLDTEIATYNRMQEDLEANHKGEWAVIHGEELIGTYTDFQEAAKTSVKLFGRGPCLVREIGAPPLVLPPYILERQIRPRETETGQPGPLDTEIATYNRMREYLEANHHWEWVVIHGEELIGTYTDFQVAADTAVRRFGWEPFLLRRVAWPPARLPASVLYRPLYDGR